METFNIPKDFVENAEYPKNRHDTLEALDLDSIDEPIVDVVAGFSTLPHCFTLQCCYGHFICTPKDNPCSLEPLPCDYKGVVQYRIAYIAFCLENSRRGRTLRDSLAQIASIDSRYIQFGSPDWFWKKQVNSYALQVEPFAYQFEDEVVLEATEALRVQSARNLLFNELRQLIAGFHP